MRRLGDVLLDMEPLIQEMMDDHDLQWGDMLGLIYAYLQAHYPSHREVYTIDGKSPIFYYGPASGLKKGGGKSGIRNTGKNTKNFKRNRLVNSNPKRG